jgi:predicted Na+-dependent transporter
LASSISAVLVLLTLKSWNFINSAFTIYILIVCVIIFTLVQYKLGKPIARAFNLKRA